jgi:hypothetical protein
MRYIGSAFAILIIMVMALTGCSTSGQIPGTAGAGTPAPSSSNLGGPAGAGPGAELDGDDPAVRDDSAGNEPTDNDPTDNDPTDNDPTDSTPAGPGVDTGSAGAGGRWPNVFNSWTGGGDPVPDCKTLWGSTPDSPYIGDGSAELATIFLGTDRQICLAGFDTHSDIALTIERPDGSRHTVTVAGGQNTALGPTELLTQELAGVVSFADHGDYLATDFGQLEPSMPVGTYAVTARQGELGDEAIIELQHGPLGNPDFSQLKPQDTYEYAHSVRVGDQLTVLLLGFPPDSTVPLAIYRNTGVFREFGTEGASEYGDGYDFAYTQELPAVNVNSQGWAYHKITVPDSLQAATDYCVVTLPNLMTPYCQPYFTFTFALAG